MQDGAEGQAAWLVHVPNATPGRRHTLEQAPPEGARPADARLSHNPGSGESLSDAVLPAPGQVARPTQSELMKLTARSAAGMVPPAAQAAPQAAPSSTSGMPAGKSTDRGRQPASVEVGEAQAPGIGGDSEDPSSAVPATGPAPSRSAEELANALPSLQVQDVGVGGAAGMDEVEVPSAPSAPGSEAAAPHQRRRSASRTLAVNSLKTIAEVGVSDVEDIGC